ncbi:hypothetical protein M405DRAFT_830450 [Rhizopogon salebrosus TDB-379]|nr:hypothetical protein M405DRAFT_830450 [Rhizopogon salebrosus TDB-379]
MQHKESQKDRLRNICELRGETNERQKVSQLWTITCSLRFHIVKYTSTWSRRGRHSKL